MELGFQARKPYLDWQLALFDAFNESQRISHYHRKRRR